MMEKRSKNNNSSQTPVSKVRASLESSSDLGRRFQIFLIDHLIWVLVGFVFIGFSAFVEGYSSLLNIKFILYVAAPLGLLVFAQVLALISGNLDLSISQNAGLSAMLVGAGMVSLAPEAPGWLLLLMILAVSASLGAINGFFIGWMRINAFLVTLSTYLMFDWLTYYVRKGAVTKIPKSLTVPGGDQLFGIHIAVYILIATAVVLHVVLKYTKLGSAIRAMGSNSDAAQMLGISYKKINLAVFTLSGLLAGGAAILYIGYLRSIPSTIAEGDTLFLAFAGAIIGGVDLNGGRGTIMGALGGILLMGVIQAGTTMIDMDPSLRGFFNGLILLAAVMINRVKFSMRDKLVQPKEV